MTLVKSSSPVAYFIFNRPRHTRETFAAIRNYRPSQLFIIADGPRQSHISDNHLCSEVRGIVSEIDWPCEVFRNYSSINLGCGRRISSGLDWVFSIVDSAIIIEDDCLASQDFFYFCNELLAYYQDNNNVWVISGNSYQPEFQRGSASYYFSKYPDCWGWATWRRAWIHYDHDMSFLDTWKKSTRWEEVFPTRAEQHHFYEVFKAALNNVIDTWDYQWVGCILYHGGLSATINGNLVENIGFDEEATHTINRSLRSLNYEVKFLINNKIIHPSRIAADIEADKYHIEQELKSRSRNALIKRIINRSFNLLKLKY